MRKHARITYRGSVEFNLEHATATDATGLHTGKYVCVCRVCRPLHLRGLPRLEPEPASQYAAQLNNFFRES